MATAAPDPHIQSDIASAVENIARQRKILLAGMAKFGNSFEQQEWVAAYNGTPDQQLLINGVEQAFTLIFNDMNELAVQCLHVAGVKERKGDRWQTPEVYEECGRLGVFPGSLVAKLKAVNAVRNRMTHKYTRIRPEESHRAITDYAAQIHTPWITALDTWLQRQGYNLI